jgi:hydrogenase maturation protease
MYLLHAIAGRDKVILIDCAKMGTPPGTIRRFTPDDVQTVKKLAHLSLHEIDILKVLDLARMIDQCPDEVVIFGIEPTAIKPRQGLTPLLETRIPEYLQVISQEIHSLT